MHIQEVLIKCSDPKNYNISWHCPFKLLLYLFTHNEPCMNFSRCLFFYNDFLKPPQLPTPSSKLALMKPLPSGFGSLFLVFKQLVWTFQSNQLYNLHSQHFQKMYFLDWFTPVKRKKGNKKGKNHEIILISFFSWRISWCYNIIQA